ncbi:unnamed protein product [Hyaloperonospora brassicae]|uniref:Fanconi-associated nuclease n=1 Tax=Hyaloperonospora brassicae TaxID=162125 RepID=A0AAV0TBL5_HYABA|nr:unnamed protein product [Hyaloperonospora brassicae]
MTAPAHDNDVIRHDDGVVTTTADEAPTRADDDDDDDDATPLRHVFSAAEVALATRFLVDIGPRAQQLYARLLQRQATWVKTASLCRYFVPRQETARYDNDNTTTRATARATTSASATATATRVQRGHDEQVQSVRHTDVQHVVRAMLDAGLVQPFPVSSAWLPDMATVAAHHPLTGQARVEQQQQERATLDTVLDAVARCASTLELSTLYRRMTGGRRHAARKGDLLAAVRAVAKTQTRINGSKLPVAQLMQQIWLDAYPLAGKQLVDVMVLRLTPATRDLMLRMHRLFYMASTPVFRTASLGPLQVADGRALLALAVQKLRQEPTPWPGLMVTFQKIVYPAYAVQDSALQRCSRTHCLFPSSEAYVSYEVAYQLHRIMSVVKQCLCIVPPEKQFEEPELELKWMLWDTAPPVFLAFQRLLAVGCKEEKEEKEEEEEEEKCEAEADDDDVVLVMDSMSRDADGSEDWQMRSWDQFYREVEAMESLDDLVLASRSCLQTYLKWMATGAASRVVDVPVFLAKCNAGYHLVRILHVAVGLYEKMRRYQVATLLLNDVLAAPFLEHKRGYWWDRLALNLEHMKCIPQAIDTCVNALEDDHVLAADRLALERRLHRLRRCYARQEEAHRVKLQSSTGLARQQRATTSASVQVVAISDDEDEDEEKAMAVAGQCTYSYRQDHIVGRPLNRQTGEKSRFVGYDDEPCTVEQLVLQYYRDHCPVDGHDKHVKTGGWYGLHCEGSVLRNLFGLLMWDVLYASVPAVFQTPFQSGPLDFGYADVFYAARRDLIDEQLRLVQHTWTLAELLTAVASRWKAEVGKVTRFVQWPSDDNNAGWLTFHLLTIAAIGRTALANLLRYMATSSEFHQAQNGLPDLLVLRFELPSRARDHARQWLHWCVDRHDCLNVHAFCSMDEHLNMNAKTRSSVERLDGNQRVSGEKLEESIVDTVLELVRESGAVQLKCVEVKGPRDRLSDKQLLWLQVLNKDICLDANVMHVEEPEKRAKRKKTQHERTGSEQDTVCRKRQCKGRE